MNPQIQQIIEWLAGRETTTRVQRRFIDGEIHRILMGMPVCDWFNDPTIEPRSCRSAWPAECGDFAQRNNDLPYEPCGTGLMGCWIDGVWLDRAPQYTGEFSPHEIAALLHGLFSR